MKGNTVAFFLKFSGQLQRAKAREHIQLYLFTLFNTRNYNTKNKVNKYKEQLQIQNDREMVTNRSADNIYVVRQRECPVIDKKYNINVNVKMFSVQKKKTKTKPQKTQ